MDRYLLVSQGETFYVTELLAQVEGMQRGPAGNTSLTAAIALAKDLDDDKTIVVQETEYTGAGKCPSAQLTFAKENGVIVRTGNPEENNPGKEIVIPEHPSQLHYTEMAMDRVRKSYVKQAIKARGRNTFSEIELKFIAEETNLEIEQILKIIEELKS
jgi:hypothetical protein